MSNSYSGYQGQPLTNTHMCNLRKKDCQCFYLLQYSPPKVLRKYYFFHSKVVNHPCLKMLLSVVLLLKPWTSNPPMRASWTWVPALCPRAGRVLGREKRPRRMQRAWVSLASPHLLVSPWTAGHTFIQRKGSMTLKKMFFNSFENCESILFSLFYVWIIYKIHSWITTWKMKIHV